MLLLLSFATLTLHGITHVNDSEKSKENQIDNSLTQNDYQLADDLAIVGSESQILKPGSLQSKDITGRVTAETGQPLAGVTVFAKGTTTGTFTDSDGRYKLSIPSGTISLVFSFVGMKTVEEPVGTRTVIDMVLYPEEIGLDEVVVVGYGEQKKVNLTGSVSTVQKEDLVKVPSANISEILTGKAPGLLTKQSTGVPGQDFTTLSIRGYDAPLVLVDGIETSWSRLDPTEIESISVLKDAAAAVYGSRAGNGVVLITTKRGAGTKPSINYSSNFTFQNPTVLPEYISSWKYAEMLREGEFNSGIPYTYTEEEIQLFKDGTDPDYINEDWYSAIFRNWALMQSHNLGISGGNERVKFFLSVGYLDQQSTFKSGDLKFGRYNARSNVDAQISDRLSVSVDLSYRNEQRFEPQATFQNSDPLTNIWTDLKLALPVWPARLPDPDIGGAYSGFTTRSPLAQTYSELTGSIDDRQQYWAGRISLNYKIPVIEGLEFNALLNYTGNNTYVKNQDKPFEVFSYDNANDLYVSWGINGENTLTEEFTSYTQLYPLVSLKYENTFGNHAIQGLLLAEGINTDYNYLSGGRVNLLSLEIPYMFAGSPENITNNSGAVETGRVSYVGRANYSFKNKYLVEGTFRYDASHKFPEETRWGFFPSVSAGWRISEESFVKDNISWIDNLKIRASYSKAGDDNVSAFKYLTGYEILSDPTQVYVFGSNVYRLIRSTGLPNPDITWLDMTSYNIGLDGRFLDGLIGVELDFFYRLTENIFGQHLEAYPSTFGATLPQLNLNSTDDRGFELTLSHRNKIGRDFTYSMAGTVSLAREKYKDWSEVLYDDPDEIRIYKKTGNYTNRWIGYKTDGLFMSQQEIDECDVNQDEANNSTLVPGDIRYVDLNGDKIIDWRDQDQIGYGTFPDLVYALDMQADYKGIGITILLQGASMFNINIDDTYRGPLTNWGPPLEFHYKYRWQPDPTNPDVNINPDARLPALVGDGTGTRTHNRKTSDFWLQDATYLRLKNLNISYTIPNVWTKKAGIQDLRLFIAGSNVLTISKLGIYKNSQDPEGGGLKYYPPVKTVSFGLNVTL
jgi:TonB-linked SusC/RagA family outer membrane protein